ncbi:putative leucine-rich repeat domain, L domain-containing protein [Rosa chinensis]|uniref:Putative leucine-rich repeat domain, L domain-containing protein n=1 Tax=Rosa chinensis TaxID=74649 RepID=A0A2P6QHL2_ROSCH|nr:putative leucine-rich repeat domain, L domain-containing protein [Rosa chinensis]
MCKTLRVLKLYLKRFADTKPPTSGCCFPSLKFLHVTVFNPVTTMQKLFSRCPVLEDLTIDGTIDVDFIGIDDNFKISAPELKMLRISLEINQDPIDVYINSPNLENIDLKRFGLTNFFLMGSEKSLVNASVAFRGRSEFEAEEQQVLSNVLCNGASGSSF